MNYFQILSISARIQVKWVGVTGGWCVVCVLCAVRVYVMDFFIWGRQFLAVEQGNTSMVDISLINEQRVEDRKLTIIVTAVGIMPCFQSG